MFIVTKLNTQSNEVEIIDVGKGGDTYSFHVAYMALLDDCNQYIKEPQKYSVKNISKARIEITIKNLFTSYLGYVYEIHDTDATEEGEAE